MDGKGYRWDDATKTLYDLIDGEWVARDNRATWPKGLKLKQEQNWVVPEVEKPKEKEQNEQLTLLQETVS